MEISRYIFFLVLFLENNCDSLVVPKDAGEAPRVNTQADTSLFGDNVSKNNIKWGPPLQVDMAQTWTSIIENGRESQEKESLMGKYLVPEDTPRLGTPKLHNLVEKVVPESVKQRDIRLPNLQSPIGASI